MNTTHRRYGVLLPSVFLAMAAGGAPAQADTFLEMVAQFQALTQICGADAQRHCSGVLPGGGRILACLQNHTAELTPQCQSALPAAETLKSKASESGALPR